MDFLKAIRYALDLQVCTQQKPLHADFAPTSCDDASLPYSHIHTHNIKATLRLCVCHPLCAPLALLPASYRCLGTTLPFTMRCFLLLCLLTMLALSVQGEGEIQVESLSFPKEWLKKWHLHLAQARQRVAKNRKTGQRGPIDLVLYNYFADTDQLGKEESKAEGEWKLHQIAKNFMNSVRTMKLH